MTKLYLTNKLKEWREERGWTQNQVTEFIKLHLNKDVSLSLVQKWEDGIKPITPEMAVELIKIFKISSEDLFERR